MERATVCVLIHETPGTHGVHDTPTTEERTRFCTVRSAGRSEVYAAMAVGLNPNYVLKLALREEYDDEQRLILEGKEYRITRSYETDDGGIELTVQRSDTE